MSKIDVWERCNLLLDQLVAEQQKKLLLEARKILPYVTSEDVLQPNDFPELENNPHFRYEEGIWTGLLSAQIALRALQRDLVTQVASRTML